MPATTSLPKLIAINATVLAALLLGANMAAALWLDRATREVPRDGTSDSRIALPAYEDKDEARRIFRDFYRTRAAYSPYEAFRLAPFASETVNVDQDGRRIVPGAGSDGAAVRLFGGSTMWGTGVDDAHTIPALLQRHLPNARVVNHGQSAFVSLQNMAALTKLAATGAPLGTVVFYDGVNDIFHLCQARIAIDGHAFSYFIEQALEALGNARHGENGRLWKATVGYLVEAAMMLAGAKTTQTVDVGEVPPSRCTENPAALGQIVDVLWHNWMAAKALVEANNGRFIAVLQPVSSVGDPRRDYLPATPEWDRWYLAAYAALRQRIAESGSSFAVDLSMAFDGDRPLYIDWCHVTKHGNAIIADRIARVVKGTN